MIERKIIKEKFNEFSIEKFIKMRVPDVPIKLITFEKTPLGERITIHTSAPGLVIGRSGVNIKKLTLGLKEVFNFENPQIKINEVKEPFLSASVVARIMANNLARFGSKKFKLTGFKALTNVMMAGAMGVEIKITGKLPSSRAKQWRFAKGYLKKTGYVSDHLVDHSVEHVTLKTGVVGIKVSIMLPNTPLPDKIKLVEDLLDSEEISKQIKINDKVEEIKEAKKIEEIAGDEEI